MNLQPFQPGRTGRRGSPLERALTRWLNGVGELLPGAWARHLAVQVNWKVRSVEVRKAEDAFHSLREDVLAHRIQLGTRADRLLWCVPRRFALALALQVVGETHVQSVDRPLTAVESDLYAMLVQEGLLASLGTTWPGPSSLALTLREIETLPRWSRLYPSQAEVWQATVEIEGPFGVGEGQLLGLAEPVRAELALPADGEALPPPPADLHDRLAAAVKKALVPLHVELGTATVPLERLANLKQGDVLVLKRRIDDRLTAYLAGRPKWHVWCGRVGVRQAVLLDTPVEA